MRCCVRGSASNFKFKLVKAVALELSETSSNKQEFVFVRGIPPHKTVLMPV